MTPAAEERELDSDMPFVKLTGRFMADEQGYSVVNEDGQVVFYLARKVGNWSADADRYHGLHIELVLSPEGQMTLVEISP